MRIDRTSRFRAYARRRRARGQESLACFFAWAEIRRAARQWARLPPTTPLVIVLVVPPGGDLDAHATAASLVFDEPVGRSDGGGSCVVALDRTIETGTARGANWLISRASRVVAVAREAEDVPDLLRIAADNIVPLEAPCATHLLAAAKIVLRVPMSREEAERLEDERVDILIATLRHGRPAVRSVILADRLHAARQTVPTGPLLEDLHGLGEAGKWGRELARDVAEWRAGLIGWKEVDGGVLLSGPPGTGKTMFAAALARSARMNFVSGSVARWQAAGKLDDHLGAMRQAFDDARRQAPSILFIDEVDAVGDRENFSGENGPYHSQVVACLLECLDGAEGREGVVVVGATNRPQALDAALRRPGRLDRHLIMPLPDGPEREAILRLHLGKVVDRFDFSHVVSWTEDWTGAMLERLARDASRLARRERRTLQQSDIEACIPTMIRLSDADIWRTAVHEAGHVVAAECLRPGSVTKAFLRSGLDPAASGSQHGGCTVRKATAPRHQTVHDILEDVAVSLAGGVAEDMVFGERSTASGGSPASDLHAATLDLLRIDLSYGLGDGLAFVSSSSDDRALLECMAFDGGLRERIELGLRQQQERVGVLLARMRPSVQAIAEALRDRGKVGPADVRGMLNAPSRTREGQVSACRHEACHERS